VIEMQPEWRLDLGRYFVAERKPSFSEISAPGSNVGAFFNKTLDNCPAILIKAGEQGRSFLSNQPASDSSPGSIWISSAAYSAVNPIIK